jgi:hypothetical protein
MYLNEKESSIIIYNLFNDNAIATMHLPYSGECHTQKL